VVIHPCRNIEIALGVSERTVYWWAKTYGLPLFHLPDGQLATTVGMIEEWARERRQDELTRCPSREELRQRKHTRERMASSNYGKTHMVKVA
jgi:hypothetical protein